MAGVRNPPSPGNASAHAPGRRAVLVAGMHRSGTSALTRVLSLCGLALPKTLMRRSPSRDGNSGAGYWESEPITALQDELLAAADTGWDEARDIDPDWFHSAACQSFVDRAVDCLRNEFGDSASFVLKDPRICRLVPFWQQVLRRFGVGPAFVLPIRPPWEVASSLRRRNGMPAQQAQRLWLHYVLVAERDTRGEPRVFVELADLMVDWRAVVGRVAKELDLPLQVDGTVAQRVESFLDPSLLHTRGGEVAASVAPAGEEGLAVRVWERLREACAGGDVPWQALDALADELRAGDWSPLPHLASEVEDDGGTDLRVPATRWETTRLEGRLERLERRHDRQARAHHEVLAENRDLEERQRRMAERLEAVEARLEAAVAELARLTSGNGGRPERGKRRTIPAGSRLARPRPNLPRWIGGDLIRRWIRWRQARAVVRSGLFHADFYLASNPDVAAAGLDPVYHYVACGAAEGRDPNPFFDTTFYLEHRPDVAASGLNPLVHYVARGAAEGSPAGPAFDTAAYVRKHPELSRTGINPLRHFLEVGASVGDPSVGAPSGLWEP